MGAVYCFSAIPFVYRRRETANPVPAKVFLKVKPDSFMLFSQSVCVYEEGNGPPSASQGLPKGEPRHGHAVVT